MEHMTYLLLSWSIPTVLFLFYLFCTLYKCCCSRRYAEWRTSWSETLRGGKHGHRAGLRNYSELVSEALPVTLQGHEEDIELIATNDESPFVASICMRGDVLIWDVLTGECHTYIKRSCPPPPPTRSEAAINGSRRKSAFMPSHKPTGSFSSDSTYGSSPGNTSMDFPFADSYSNCNTANNTPTNHIATTPASEHGRYLQHPTVAVASSSGLSPQTPQPQGATAPGLKSKHRRQASLPAMPFSSSSSSYLASNNHNHSNKQPFNFSPSFARMNTSNTVISELILSASTSDEALGNGKLNIITNTSVESPLAFNAVWSSDLFDRWLYLGTEKSRLEVWDVLTGMLTFSNESTNGSGGISALKASASLLAIAYMNGVLEIYRVKRIEGDSTGIQLYLLHAARAHQQPITALALETSHVITGSLDHQLKVYRADTCAPEYTLRGHHGGITVVQTDPSLPAIAISGCAVGLVMIWDLSTGTCVFSLEGHSASVTALVATPQYVISAATDNKVCIWDKFSGNLVKTIPQQHSLAKQIVLLSPNILITAKEDQLVVWDISEGTPLRYIDFSPRSTSESQAFIKSLRVSSQSRVVVCDCGPQLCFVHFPGVTQKFD